MSIHINTTFYKRFIDDINFILPTGKRVMITILNGNDETSIANDNLGNPISSRQFYSISYQYPIDNIPGFLLLSFSDGSNIKVDDDNDSLYYFIGDSSSGIKPLQ